MVGDREIQKLLDGNKRFVIGELAEKDVKSRREELVDGQDPIATVICCSDSRVCPEMIFDTNLGEIFEIDIAGNIIDEISLGSIEYGVGKLETPLLIVMGHQNCGAITATYEGYEGGHITSIVDKLKDTVEYSIEGHQTSDESIERAVQENVMEVISLIKDESGVVREKFQNREVKIVGMEYYLDSGEVEILNSISY